MNIDQEWLLDPGEPSDLLGAMLPTHCLDHSFNTSYAHHIRKLGQQIIRTDWIGSPLKPPGKWT